MREEVREGHGGSRVKAKLYLHPTAIPHAPEVEKATGTVAVPTPSGTAVQLLRRMPPSWEALVDIGKALGADEIRVCRGPYPWEEE